MSRWGNGSEYTPEELAAVEARAAGKLHADQADFRERRRRERERERQAAETTGQVVDFPGAGNSPSSPRLATLDEIESDSVPDALCERLVYQAMPGTIVGLPKQGKTYFALQLALCIGAGQPFLDLETRRSRVLYCSWELPLGLLRKRMDAIHEATLVPDWRGLHREGWLHLYSNKTRETARRIDLGDGNDWPAFRDLCNQARADVVVLDTLSKCARLEHKDTTAWGDLLANLAAYGRETGRALVILDHAHRGRVEDSAAIAAMGSQTKGADFAVVAKLQRRKADDDTRWRVEVDSWFDDDGEALWYERPEHGAGCVPSEELEEPKGRPRSGRQIELEAWLSHRLGQGPAYGSKIAEEAAGAFPGLKHDTLARKLRRALQTIGGESIPEGPRETVWTLDRGGA